MSEDCCEQGNAVQGTFSWRGLLVVFVVIGVLAALLAKAVLVLCHTLILGFSCRG
jgi:hypothetical protein